MLGFGRFQGKRAALATGGVACVSASIAPSVATGYAVSVSAAPVWGRPTALAVTKDGALLVADDTGGTIWRISYEGPKRQTSPGSTTGGR